MVTHDADVAVEPAELAQVVTLSDERDLWHRRVLTAWRDGYRAAADDLDDTVLAAFADGWRLGLLAGAERGTAA